MNQLSDEASVGRKDLAGFCHKVEFFHINNGFC